MDPNQNQNQPASTPQNAPPVAQQAQPAVQPAPSVPQVGGQATPPAQNSDTPAQPAPQAQQPAPANNVSFGNPPNATAAMPPPPKRGFPVKIVIIVGVIFLLIFAGIIGFTLLTNTGGEDPVVPGDQVFAPSSTPVAGPDEHVAEEYPDYEGVPIDENTASFNKVDESFRIKYLGSIYHEQDTGMYQPREVFPETADDFEWYGLIDTPENVVGDPELFSFKAPPTYRSFVFIMKWDDSEGEKYEMYRFANNQVTKLEEFRRDRSFYVPVIDNFSLGGNFMSINIFSCPTCFDDEPEILLYHIPSGETRNIGRVSYFAWGDDDNAYEYKEYQEGVDPDTINIRKNEFFVESVDILNP